MRFPMRTSPVAGLLLVAYLELFITPVMAEKTRSTPFKLGNMSAKAVARTPTVTSLVEALITNSQISTKRVASALKEIEPPNPEASLLLDLLAAGESSCPQKDSITRDFGTGNSAGKDTTSNLESHSLGSCSDVYELCFESCSVGKGLFKKKNTPAEGSCHVVCAVAQEGCQSCSKKHYKRSMITTLQGLVRVVSTVVYWMCYLLAVITCCVGTITWLVVGLFYLEPTMPLFSWAESWLPPAIVVVIFNPFVVMGVIAWSIHRAWLDPSAALLKLWQFISNQAPFSATLVGWVMHVSYIRRQMDRLRQEVQRRSVIKVRQGQDEDGQVYMAMREAVVADEETRRLRDWSARPNTRGRTTEITNSDSAQITSTDNRGDIVNDGGNNIDHNGDNDNKDLSDDNDNADNETTDNDDNDNDNDNDNDIGVGNGNGNDNDTTDNDDTSSNNDDNINTDQEDNNNDDNDTAAAYANDNENDNEGNNSATSIATTATNDGANEDNGE
ncbi:unnamed protein product [Ectocarpus sp. 6 AP-2014]